MTSTSRGGLRARLTRTLVGLGLISVILLAVVNFVVVRELINSGVRDQLVTLRDMRSDAIDRGIDRALGRVAVLGGDPGVVSALEEFGAAYAELETEQVTEAQLEEVRDAYSAETARYDAVDAARPTLDELVPSTPAGQYVQYHYIAANPEPDDARSQLVDAGDGSEYSAVHARYHGFLRDLVAGVGATDLLLVDLESGDVVYSVDKRVDLGTDVDSGPYADEGLGTAWRALSSAAVDTAVIADSDFYFPNSSAPVVHVATAVRSSTGVLGAVVVSLPIRALTDIVTAGQQWDLLGLGDTGEAYIVGSEGRLRTVPRPWFEDPEGYIDRFRDIGGAERTIELFEFTGSPVLIQEVDNQAVRLAGEGEEFVGSVKNYLDRSTVAASAPLEAGGLGWMIVTEQESGETRSELWRFLVTIGILLVILLPLLALVGTVLARVLARPVEPLVAAAGRIADGDYETEVPDLGRNELGDVGRQLDAVAAELRDREASIEAEEDRIATMLASVLPPALVARVRSGERELADVVDTATVVAVAVRGVPEPSGAEQDAVLELTERLTEEAGRLAEEHGLERAQAALEKQLFVAGRGDRGTRADEATAFSLELIDAVAAIGAELGVAVTAGAGLSAGLVASGVLGSQQLSFSIWGDCVTTAIELGSQAEAGQILADATVVDDLRREWATSALDDGSDRAVYELGAPAEAVGS